MGWTLPPETASCAKWKCEQPLNREERHHEGYDSWHRFGKDCLLGAGVDSHGMALLKRQIQRDQLPVFLAKLEPCLIGMEACGIAHH